MRSTLKAIAVTSAKRNPLLPQVPTIAESGVAGFEAIAGQGLFVAAGTPRDIVTKLNADGNVTDMLETLADTLKQALMNDQVLREQLTEYAES